VADEQKLCIGSYPCGSKVESEKSLPAWHWSPCQFVWVLQVCLGGLFAWRTSSSNRCRSIGAALRFGGIADLLTPTPKMPNVAGPGGIGSGATSGRSREEQERSFTFDKSNANTQQGEVVPVLYGERIIGSLPVLSFGLELQNSL
jgi:predicted phage tail protein